MADQWLSIVEYARTFAVSDMTIRRRIKTGRIKAVLKEGKYYIPVGPNGEILEESVEVMPLQAAAPAPPPEPRHETRYEPRQEAMPSYISEPSPRPGASYKTLPQAISQNLLRAEHSLVDTQSLLQFCDKTVTRINSIEKHLQDSFQARIHSLESQLKMKDATIAHLKQQAEDLQILVKLMERR